MADTKHKISPQGYDYPDTDEIYHPFYDEDDEGYTPSKLPIASKTQAGVVKIGDGVNVSDDGTISVDATSGGGGVGKTPVITASASVSDTVGTPAVAVSKTGTDEEPHFDFTFINLKGEKGERGEKGESITGPRGPKGDPGESITGPQGEQGEAGYSPTATVIQDEDGATITITSKPGDVEETTTAKVKNGRNGVDGKDGDPGEPGKDGVSPTVSATGSTESGALAGTITGANGEEIKVYNGAKGQDGSGGESPAYTLPAATKDTLGGVKVGNGLSIADDGTLSADAQPVDTSGLVSDVSMTNEDGVYTLSQEKGGEKTEIGTIEVPKVDTDNLLAEVKDSVVSNDTSGYDFHTIQETENNGAQNDVGKFYLAQNQITDISATGNQINIKTVNQSGTEDTKSVEIASEAEVDLTNVVNNIKMTSEDGKYQIVQAKGDPASSTETTVGDINIPVYKLEEKPMNNYSAIKMYVLNGNNNMIFATYDNQYGLTFSPLMDIDVTYDEKTHKLTFFAAAAAIHTSGSNVGDAYYETKTTKEISLPPSNNVVKKYLYLESSTYNNITMQSKGYVSSVTFTGQIDNFQSSYQIVGYTLLGVSGQIGGSSSYSTLDYVLPAFKAVTVSSSGRVNATLNLYNFGNEFKYNKLRVQMLVSYLS